MIIFAIRRDQDEGQIIFSGTLDECEKQAKEIKDLFNYYSINICQDNGEIVKRILRPQQPIF